MTGLRPYPDYKDSGVEWLGAIPAQWPVKPANAVVRERKARSVPGDEHLTPSQTHGVLPQSEYMSRTGNKVVLNLTGADSMRHVEPNDFISHLRSFQGGFEHSRLAGKVSAAYTVLEPLVGIVPEFYRYLFKSAMYVQALQTTTDQLRDGQSIRFAQVVLLPLPVPDMETQKFVANFLDQETTQIDAFIADQEELIELLTERRAATISHAVTKGLDPSVPMKDIGTEWLGEVPADWQLGQIRRLRPHCESGTSVNGYPFPIADGDIGVLKTGSVSKGYFDPRENKQVTDDDLGRVTVPVRRGALLVNRANSPDIVGAGALVRAAAPGLYLSDKLWQLDFDFGSTDFLYYWTQSSYYRSQIRSLSVGASSSMQNLSYSDFLSLAVTYPEITEQQRIAEYLDQETVKLDAAITDARTAITLSRERGAALISAAVTGKIDVRDVSGER